LSQNQDIDLYHRDVVVKFQALSVMRSGYSS
jgi:hypothetical protein